MMIIYGDMERPPALCPRCGRTVTVNRVTGLLRAHHVTPAGLYCPGSGTQPQDGPQQ